MQRCTVCCIWGCSGGGALYAVYGGAVAEVHCMLYMGVHHMGVQCSGGGVAEVWRCYIQYAIVILPFSPLGFLLAVDILVWGGGDFTFFFTYPYLYLLYFNKYTRFSFYNLSYS